MIKTLDLLNVYVENQAAIVIPRKCKWAIEGSGFAGSDDEEAEEEIDCEEEDDDLITGGEDFMFEENRHEVAKPNSKNNPMVQFGVKLNGYSSQVFRKSEYLYESTFSLLTTSEGKF